MADKVQVDIIANSDKANKNILKFAAGATAAAAAVGAMVKISKELISAYSVQEQAEARLAQTILATGHAANLSFFELKNMASGLQGVTKFGDEAIIGAESLLLTFKDIGEDTFPKALKSILNVSEAMGQDLNSTTVQVGKALNDPVAGISALTRVGIQFSDKQKEMISGMIEMNDKAGAQAVILAELESQFGGVAEAAADTATGALVQLGNALGDTKEAYGKLVAEGINPFVKAMKEQAEATNAFLNQQSSAKSILKDLEDGILDEEYSLQELADTLQIVEQRQFGAMGGGVDMRGMEQAVPMLEALINNFETEDMWLIKAEESTAALARATQILNDENKTATEKQEADLQRLYTAYAQTDQGIKAALEGELNWFKALEIQGPKTLAVIAMLEERISALDKTDEGGAEEEMAVNAVVLSALEARSEGYQNYYVTRAEMREKDLEAELAAAEEQKNIDRAVLSSKADLFGGLSDLADIWAEDNKAMFIVSKMAAAAEAGINSYLAFTAALAMDPVFGPIKGAAVLASGLAAQAKILTAKVPAFASGGPHGGGLRIVGENGPEIEATGPSRIFSNSQSKKMLGGVNVNITGVCTESTAVEIVRAIESARESGRI